MSRRPHVSRNAGLMQIAAAVVGAAAAAQVIKPADGAHEHTYETAELPGAYVTHPDQLDIVGANGRRLILRWVDDGVYVGGCLITDPGVADKLATMVTREDDDA